MSRLLKIDPSKTSPRFFAPASRSELMTVAMGFNPWKKMMGGSRRGATADLAWKSRRIASALRLPREMPMTLIWIADLSKMGTAGS